jgi:tetratricopeptide (TPR) repeat protein
MFRSHRYLSVLVLTLALATTADAQSLEDGIRLFEAGDHAGARQILAGLVESEPGNAVASGYLGLTLVALRQFVQAEGYLNAASGPEPSRDRIQVGMAQVYLAERQGARALQVLAEAEQANPENAGIFFYRGIALLSTNDYARAVEQLERALALAPENAMAHYYAGLAYNGLRQSDKVVEHFQIFLRMAPDAPEAERVRSLMRALR